MVKVSANRYARRRIEESVRETQMHMETLRRSLIKSMEEIFQLAGKIIRGEVRRQRVKGRIKPITRGRGRSG